MVDKGLHRNHHTSRNNEAETEPVQLRYHDGRVLDEDPTVDAPKYLFFVCDDFIEHLIENKGGKNEAS